MSSATPKTFTLYIDSKSLNEVSLKGLLIKAPALFINISIFLNSLLIKLVALVIESGIEISN